MPPTTLLACQEHSKAQNTVNSTDSWFPLLVRLSWHPKLPSHFRTFLNSPDQEFSPSKLKQLVTAAPLACALRERMDLKSTFHESSNRIWSNPAPRCEQNKLIRDLIRECTPVSRKSNPSGSMLSLSRLADLCALPEWIGQNKSKMFDYHQTSICLSP